MSYLQELLGSAYKEGLSEEELSKAIEKAVKAKEKQAETDFTKIKNAFDKASSDIAEYKQKLKDSLSEDEKKATETQELIERLQRENAEFKRSSEIADYKAKFITSGYSEELAQKTAEALADGDMATVFANHKTAWEAKEKEIRAGVVKNNPVPPAGASGNTGLTREAILDIKDPVERQNAIAENPGLFGY